MVAASRPLSIREQQARQRRERLAGAAALVAGGIACATAMVLVTGPLVPAIGFTALLCAAAIWRQPVAGVYILFGCALAVEEWGIAGLSPLTGRVPIYQTLAGSTGVPLSISPVELLILLTFAAVVLPIVARRGARFQTGPLLAPLLIFLVAVVASIAFGLVSGSGAGPFNVKAAWAETRAFFYLGLTYILACNLIRTPGHLRVLVQIFVACIGLKSLQGVARYVEMRASGLRVDSITGHEDVVFFAAFVVLLAGLLLYRPEVAPGRWHPLPQMYAILPPLVFTLLVTRRRLGFVVLVAGLALVVLLLLRTRRDLFFRIVPVAVVVLGLYVAIFWNGTGALSEPIRAFRSIVAPTTERDRQSNSWRVLENLNIDYNLRVAPVTGLGFGRPYSFVVEQPALDATGFVYWRYIAHNAIYWVWMKMGLVGFVLFWNVIGSGIVAGIVAIRRLRSGFLRALALMATATVIMQAIFSYGDLGLTYSRSMIFLGCMLGLLARLPAFDGPPTVDDTEVTSHPLGMALPPLRRGAEERPS
jgi:hypothetical protein